jgi:hypothetical protein
MILASGARHPGFNSQNSPAAVHLTHLLCTTPKTSELFFGLVCHTQTIRFLQDTTMNNYRPYRVAGMKHVQLLAVDSCAEKTTWMPGQVSIRQFKDCC